MERSDPAKKVRMGWEEQPPAASSSHPPPADPVIEVDFEKWPSNVSDVGSHLTDLSIEEDAEMAMADALDAAAIDTAAIRTAIDNPPNANRLIFGFENPDVPLLSIPHPNPSTSFASPALGTDSFNFTAPAQTTWSERTLGDKVATANLQIQKLRKEITRRNTKMQLQKSQINEVTVERNLLRNRIENKITEAEEVRKVSLGMSVGITALEDTLPKTNS